jgi:hypothetical protein
MSALRPNRLLAKFLARRATGWMLLGLSIAAPVDATAQWAQGAPGKLWVKSAVFLQKADEQYDALGDRVPWFASGESDARAVFTDIILGLRGNLDLWLQIPYFDLRFKDAGNDLRSTGIGDIRGWLRWQFASLGSGSTPVALRVGAKAPVGTSSPNAFVIPLGEGQWDLEAFGEIGHSFWPLPVYAELWLGYRARLENTEKVWDPGGEYVFLSEVGVQPTSFTLVKATIDGFRGRRLRQDRALTANKRRITTFQLAGAFRIGPIWPEVGVRIPVAGRDFPAGTQFVFGVSSQVR